MPSFNLNRLREVRTLPSLVKYLRDELGWPIDQDAVEDDLTFEYQPEELGILAESAVAIKEIKQIRPLDSRQPWGVFWVNFEKKRLPVAMLRRILGHLVVKKRTRPERAKQRSWHLHDLLFISSYGEEADRAITFAHFSHDPESPGNLSVLKVLGWDGADTVLHLADAHEALVARLHWPTNPGDLSSWRKQWNSAFTAGYRHVIETTEELVTELAKLALSIRRRTVVLLSRETERGPLRRLYGAFRTALIHDLIEDDFADVIAQTLTYGLLIAKFSRPTGISADNLVDMIPSTNPFLRDLLVTFLDMAGRKGKFDFDELGIQDVVEMLNLADTEAVKRDFGNRTQREDPVIHFYEHFLSSYDKAKKIQRGVFYTPQPVVSYIVRSVHDLLKTEYGIEDGLASTVTWKEFTTKYPNKAKIPEGSKLDDFFVNILDPATGTATFLVEVIEVVFNHLSEKWKKSGPESMPQIQGKTGLFASLTEYWNSYVPAALFPRIFGYELMMAPYTIAHMKLRLKLSEINIRLGQPDYQFKFQGRAHIYLTNSLEPAEAKQMKLVAFEALAHEATEVNKIKRDKRFTVVIGNPPYAGISSNNSEYAVRLVDAYKSIDGEALGERKLWLQDDYVKFIRLSQITLGDTGTGVLGFITNHGFLDNPTFRGMRQSLMTSFRNLRFLDLHGNANKGEHAPDGREEQNVFEIKQGVAVTLAVIPIQSVQNTVDHFELWGLRKTKYSWLNEHTVRSTGWTRLKPSTPYYFFVPRNQDTEEEYQGFYPFEKAVRDRTVGMITARDSLTIHFTRSEVLQTIRRFASLSVIKAREEFSLGKDARDWRIDRAQEDLRKHNLSEKHVRAVLYRPFDIRYTFYTGTSRGFIGQPQKRIMAHLDGKKNWALCISRFNRQKSLGYFFTSRTLTDFHLLDTVADSMTVFPLYLTGDSDGQNELLLAGGDNPNISREFLSSLTDRLRTHTTQGSALPAGLTPENIFHYAYAVFHSPTYRSRYSEFLKIDFPRLPLTYSFPLFFDLAQLGNELVTLHLMESQKLDQHVTKWIGGKNPEIEKVSYINRTVWIDEAQTEGFRGVSEDVWNFHIGGYQICEKWLKYRKGRKLNSGEIIHYQKIIVAIAETIRLMKEIDEVIEKYGGWPGAFSSEKK